MFWLWFSAWACQTDPAPVPPQAQRPIGSEEAVVPAVGESIVGSWGPENEPLLLELSPSLRTFAAHLRTGIWDDWPEAWQRRFQSFSRLERVELHFGDARLIVGSPSELRTVLEVQAFSPTYSMNQRSGFDGKVEVRWVRSDAGDWEVVGMEDLGLQEREFRGHHFASVLADWVEPGLREKLERSIHEERVLESIRRVTDGGEPLVMEYESFDRHPGLAVVDLNQDGWDDILVMARWGPNQLLMNQDGKGFVDAAEEWGVAHIEHASSAIFSDFDNDGDSDLLVGRTLAPSLLLENQGQTFKVVSDRAHDGPLPLLVSSVSASDVNNDGLVDFYLSTYASSMIEGVYTFQRERDMLGAPVLADFISETDAVDLGRALTEPNFSFFLERPGPRNVLLWNRGGGRFERAPSGHPLSQLRNTYQASWADFDLDGDADVYLANDFASNTLLRNDGEDGFTDMTEQTGTADFGFGMGVSWGDYNDDGRPDLYVSNMYSRAGQRITGAMDALDPRIPKAARGNTLFRNDGDRFTRVSSLDDGGMQVERAGWAWGGQFGDVNNDGLEDLYVLNGYYSAPQEAALDRDS